MSVKKMFPSTSLARSAIGAVFIWEIRLAAISFPNLVIFFRFYTGIYVILGSYSAKKDSKQIQMAALLTV